MLTKQYTIIEPFVREPWRKYTFKDIKEISQNKSDNYVYVSLKTFVKNRILLQNKIGNIITYEINPETHALNLIGYVAEFRAQKANIPKIIEKIKTSFYIYIITGSYAKNKQTKTSDLDIVIICESNPKKILAQIRFESEMLIPKVHPYVFSESEFYNMLINDEENYGKEIARNNLIITGGSQYYAILMKAIKNGFKG